MQIPVGLPFLVRRLHHRLVAAGAGVVDENVGAAEQPLDVGDEVVRPLARGDVAGHPFGPDAEGFGDAPRLAANPLHAASGDDDVDALGREALGDRKPDADAAAGDDGDLPLEPEVHPAPSRFASHAQALPARIAAVGQHDRPGHQTRGVGGEKHDDGRDLIRLAHRAPSACCRSRRRTSASLVLAKAVSGVLM